MPCAISFAYPSEMDFIVLLAVSKKRLKAGNWEIHSGSDTNQNCNMSRDSACRMSYFGSRL